MRHGQSCMRASARLSDVDLALELPQGGELVWPGDPLLKDVHLLVPIWLFISLGSGLEAS